MSASKLALITLAIAYVEARFGQEGLIQANIAALDAFGEAGDAATLAGQTPGVLLGGAGACEKLALADEIVATLGNDPEVIAGAASLVAAEKNFNNFQAETGALCADATLPATEELRGILSLFDPAVDGADVQNENSATSLQTPFDATGLSEAEIAIEQGFTNFIAQDADGAEVALAGLDAAGGGADAADDAAADDAAADDAAADDAAADDAAADDAAADDAAADDAAADDAAADDAAADDAAADDAAADDAAADAADDAAANDDAQADEDAGQDEQAADDAAEDDAGGDAAGGAADFGDCDPTIVFEGGLGGRPADEFTFQSADATIAANQQEALNPDIIVNRICDELGNTCGANDAAIQACLDAQQDLIDQGLGVGSEGEDVLAAFNDAILAA